MRRFARFGTIRKFKKRKKHPWRSATFRSVQSPATLLKVTLRHGCFSHCLKLHKWYQMAQSIKYDN